MLVELSTNPNGYMRAAFHFSEPRRMRVELDISLVGNLAGPARALASIRRLIDESERMLTPHDHCGECNWYGLMNLVRRCHEQACAESAHVLTTLHIEDEEEEDAGTNDSSTASLSDQHRTRGL